MNRPTRRFRSGNEPGVTDNREKEMTVRRTILKSTLAAAGLALFGISAVAADELDALKEKGVIRIAMSGAYPPFNFVNDENKVVGFDPAIGTEIAKRMGMEAEIVTTAWDGIIGGLLANKYDAIVGSMTITAERDEVVDFVGPYYSDKRAIFTKPGSGIASLADLEGKKVGLTLGETHEDWAREKGYDINTYKGLPELLLELENGRVDAIVNDSIAAILAMTEKGQEFEMFADPTTEPFGAGIAIRQGNPKLAAEMQKALDSIMEDGTYLALAEEWIGADIR
ncbi:transporter substrate-binding domain-containing protein [Ruegeria sp. 1NDH52C]|uniref:Transporter substrate-binding domain-containing protein n=1 Tax=Ruegeria alba TaxID=2916756 RepID=A0ABS9NT12_9RHOB|nr:transporter substrate-binding domain-containing protein [Ruegeria alba]MCG6557362.1 transporter substrate-binding domain-containing protein [Ruegeria alba]